MLTGELIVEMCRSLSNDVIGQWDEYVFYMHPATRRTLSTYAYRKFSSYPAAGDNLWLSTPAPATSIYGISIQTDGMIPTDEIHLRRKGRA